MAIKSCGWGVVIATQSSHVRFFRGTGFWNWSLPTGPVETWVSQFFLLVRTLVPDVSVLHGSM